MKFFIDTADVDQIKEAASLGVLDGVTTNPSLMSKEKGTFHEILKEICSIVDGPVSAEIVATESGKMVEEPTNQTRNPSSVAIQTLFSSGAIA